MRKNSTIHGSTGGNAPSPSNFAAGGRSADGFRGLAGRLSGAIGGHGGEISTHGAAPGGVVRGEGIELLRIDRDQLELFVGPELHRQGISPRARRPAVAALRAFFAWACHAGLASGNPARALDYPTAGRRLRGP